MKSGGQKFFSSYGSLIHELLEKYLKGEANKDTLVTKYLTEFRSKVSGEAPNPELKLRYFESGLEYLKNLRPFPFKPISVEQKVDFDLNGKRFVGVIDCLAEDDTGILIVDHKSHKLKPRSRRKTPTETDKELDSYLRQLYLYAVWVVRKLKKKPRKLVFNCFRSDQLIREPFDDGVFYDVQKWASETADRISSAEDFPPNIDYFKCKYLCDMSDHCEYYQANFGKE